MPCGQHTFAVPLRPHTSRPFLQRWVRDDRFEGKSLTTVQPLSGTAYTVWPVMWGEPAVLPARVPAWAVSQQCAAAVPCVFDSEPCFQPCSSSPCPSDYLNSKGLKQVRWVVGREGVVSSPACLLKLSAAVAWVMAFQGAGIEKPAAP